MDDFAPGPPKEVIYENTYITEPEGYGPDAKLQRGKIMQVVGELIEERMKNQQYDPVKGAQTAKQLADDLRERVKALGYERYKLIIQVTVGQKTGQAMRIQSRCLWDTNADNSASCFYENETLYCVCQVYGLYYE
mmetsp:Transcript_40364/g.72494  ORF Transcript_40364/g.72494 Transcript_40364/m.72494 type:complete len:135 (-) Transcript_40364:1655-2059(-)